MSTCARVIQMARTMTQVRKLSALDDRRDQMVARIAFPVVILLGMALMVCGGLIASGTLHSLASARIPVATIELVGGAVLTIAGSVLSINLRNLRSSNDS